MQAHLPRHAAAGSDGSQSRNFLSRFKWLLEALAVPWLCELRNLHELNYSKNNPRTDPRVVQNIDFVWGVIIAIKIRYDMTSISRYSIQYDISCHRYPESTSPYPPAAIRPCNNAPSTTPTHRPSLTERITDQVGRWNFQWHCLNVSQHSLWNHCIHSETSANRPFLAKCFCVLRSLSHFLFINKVFSLLFRS